MRGYINNDFKNLYLLVSSLPGNVKHLDLCRPLTAKKETREKCRLLQQKFSKSVVKAFADY